LRFIHWLKLEPGAVFASTAPACCSNIPMAEYRQISVRVDEDFLKLIDAWLALLCVGWLIYLAPPERYGAPQNVDLLPKCLSEEFLNQMNHL
jgi:hypothetical protein